MRVSLSVRPHGKVFVASGPHSWRRLARADPSTWTHDLHENNTFIPRWREFSFLDNPRCPLAVKQSSLRVLVNKVGCAGVCVQPSGESCLTARAPVP